MPAFEQMDDRRPLAGLHSVLVFVFAAHERFEEAEASAERARTLISEEHLQGSVWNASLYSNRSMLRGLQGRLAEARADAEEAIAIATSLGDRYYVVSRCLPRLYQIEYELGNYRRGADIAEEMRASEYGDKPEIAINAQEALVHFRLLLDETEAAARAATELLARTRGVTKVWVHIAAILALRGQAEIAARIMGHVDARDARAATERSYDEQRSYERLRAVLGKDLSAGVLAARRSEGARMTEEGASAEALSALGSA